MTGQQAHPRCHSCWNLAPLCGCNGSKPSIFDVRFNSGQVALPLTVEGIQTFAMMQRRALRQMIQDFGGDVPLELEDTPAAPYDPVVEAQKIVYEAAE